MVRPRALAVILLAFLVVDGAITGFAFPRDVAFSIALWVGASAAAVILISLVIRLAGVVEAPFVGGMVALCLGVLLLVILVGTIGHIAGIVAGTVVVALLAIGIVENVDKLVQSSNRRK